MILAAGVGSRLGKQLPKSLTILPDGKTLLENQINILKRLNIKEIIVVVGFKKELIMEKYPEVMYVYNPIFHTTNTAKSLEKALELIYPDDVVWINGDVFLEEGVLEKVIRESGNAIAVNRLDCGEEEVKYRMNSSCEIIEISKEVVNADGEAVGVNKITKEDFQVFLHNLKRCTMQDYFEKAIEMSIKESGIVFKAVDVSMYKCIEIDFQEDLDYMRKLF
ncbi:phosphocholine cytidylyltransferase family protein [Desulfurobacterium crinifex]